MAEFDPLDLETNMSILSILFFLQFIHAYKFICHGNTYLALLTVIFVLPTMSTFFFISSVSQQPWHGINRTQSVTVALVLLPLASKHMIGPVRLIDFHCNCT